MRNSIRWCLEHGEQALMAQTVIVTGGAATSARSSPTWRLARGDLVRIFDLNPPEPRTGDAADRLEHVLGDVRDLDALQEKPGQGVGAVLNNVAQVPSPRTASCSGRST